jgi:hypothetical protein
MSCTLSFWAINKLICTVVAVLHDDEEYPHFDGIDKDPLDIAIKCDQMSSTSPAMTTTKFTSKYPKNLEKNVASGVCK